MNFFIERTEMRVIPALISFILLLVFLAPVSVRIINLGNIAGAGISVLLMTVFVFWRQFKSLVGSLWSSGAGKAAVIAAAAFICAGVVTAAVLSVMMIREMHDAPSDSNTTVVVLGCKVRDNGPSLMLARRLDAACSYLTGHPDVKVVVSGGQGKDEVVSEAECMRDYLVRRGIDSGRIYMEDKSVDTNENLRFSKEVIEKNGLPEQITLVTDGFHQLRADILAEKLGIRAYNISAATPAYLLPTYWVREWFGLIYYKILG